MPTPLPVLETTTPQDPSTAVRILEQLPDTLAKTIDVLSEKLSAPAGQLFEALSHYVFARGVTSVATAGLWFGLLLTSATLAVVWSRAVAKAKDFRESHGWLCVAIFVCIIVVCVSLAHALAAVQAGLPMLIAPEGAALVTLLRGNLP